MYLMKKKIYIYVDLHNLNPCCLRSVYIEQKLDKAVEIMTSLFALNL